MVNLKMTAKINKIWHPWHMWECYRNGFYSTSPPPDMTPEEAKEAYRLFLSDIPRFERAMARVAIEWPNSCEHFLTNTQMNRIAWLGQSAMCIETGVSSIFRGGFKLLTDDQQNLANAAAEKFLNRWLDEHA